jgi:hypothetical protein
MFRGRNCSEIVGKLDTNGPVRQVRCYWDYRGNGLTGKWERDVTRVVMMSAVASIPRFDRAVRPLPTTDETMAVVERVFAEQVAKRLHGAILRYSDRLFLLRAAHRLHIERFRANLIIALVQRETRPERVGSEVGATVGKGSGVLWRVGVVLLVEAVVVAAGYAVWRGF